MAQSRRRSPLEDESFGILGKHEPSSGDVCERCGCTREKHDDDGCACGRCEEFLEFDST